MKNYQCQGSGIHGLREFLSGLWDECGPGILFVTMAAVGIPLGVYFKCKQDKEQYLKPENWITATVSDEVVKESKYILCVKTDDKRNLSINVKDGLDGCPKEGLERLIKKGTRIQFPVGTYTKDGVEMAGETEFTDEINGGDKYASRIQILSE